MSVNFNFLFLGIAAVIGGVFLIVAVWKVFLVWNPETHETLELSFGKLGKRSTEAGYTGGKRWIPWKRWITASRQWDERIFRKIELNDSQGTTVHVDLRVTFRLSDPEKALFFVENWEETLESTTLHEASALLASKDRVTFLRLAPELSTALTQSLVKEMTAYGIQVREVRVLNVEFRPEVARQMFEAVAAKLEVAKAEYEEKGRTDAALLMGRTEEKVAEIEARAKTESLKAVGRAYEELRKRPEVFHAYVELYRLSRLDPSRLVSFDGFDGKLSSSTLVESDLELEDLAKGPMHMDTPS